MYDVSWSEKTAQENGKNSITQPEATTLFVFLQVQLAVRDFFLLLNYTNKEELN